MKLCRLFPLLVFGLVLPPAPKATGAERGGDRASFHAILIAASNQKSGSDRRLAPYEPTLKRILRFESYRFISENRGVLTAPGKETLSLGQGHKLEIEMEQSGGETRRVRVRWLEGERTLMNTGLSLRPGVPAVLGGPPWGGGGEVCAMILVAR